jgi:GntR family transcriptional regulator
VFRQLADLLREQIVDGTLAPGDPLPSELRLAQEYGLSRTTVRQAIAILRAEGLINVERPRGTFVRAAEASERVPLRRGDVVGARMPTDSERRTMHLAEGVPVLVVTGADGSRAVHPADRIELTRP